MTSKMIPVTKEMMKYKKFIHKEESTSFQIFSKKKEINNKSKMLSGKLTEGIKQQLVAANSEGMEVAMMIAELISRHGEGVSNNWGCNHG